LLEPWYEFRLEVPSDVIGRAMSDIQKMSGSFDEPQIDGDFAVLTGKAPVSEMKDYAVDVVSYTRGHGHLSCSLCGYEPCHNQDEVVAAIGYDADVDVENTADSVFCEHGAGYNVKWNEADEYMHMQVPSVNVLLGNTESLVGGNEVPASMSGKYGMAGVSDNACGSIGDSAKAKSSVKSRREEEAELDRIFEMTYGKPKQRTFIGKREILSEAEKIKIQPSKVLEEYILVDGYNIIFAWDQLKELAKVNMDSAREALIEILANYQGYKKCHMIVVFDAYRVKGGERRFEKHENVDVVYTAEAETADMYIEKTAHEKSGEYLVRVATSDRLEQMIIIGSGAFKISADEFRLEIEKANMEISKMIEELNRRNKLRNRNGIKIPVEN